MGRRHTRKGPPPHRNSERIKEHTARMREIAAAREYANGGKNAIEITFENVEEKVIEDADSKPEAIS